MASPIPSGRKAGRPRHKFPVFPATSGACPPATAAPTLATLEEIDAASKLATREGRLDLLRLWIVGVGVPDPHCMHALQYRTRVLELLMRAEGDFPATSSFTSTKVNVAVNGGNQQPALVVFANSRGPELQAGDGVVDAVVAAEPQTTAKVLDSGD